MAYAPPSPYEVEVTILSATGLKNVNWRHGDLNPYVVVWVDPRFKCSTHVAKTRDTCPTCTWYWDDCEHQNRLVLPVPTTIPIDDATLYLDVVHANAPADTKPLIGSARVSLREILDDPGIGAVAVRSLQLKRPSGRPQGTLLAKISIRDSSYRALPPPPPPPPPVYGGSYRAPFHDPYGSVAVPPVAPVGYAYDSGVYGEERKKGGRFGFGTGVALGAVGGALGALAVAEGIERLEEKIEDEVVERVEDDLGYCEDDYGGDGF